MSVDPFDDLQELHDICASGHHSTAFMIALRQSKWYALGIHMIAFYCCQHGDTRETLLTCVHIVPSLCQHPLSHNEHKIFQQLCKTDVRASNLRNMIFALCHARLSDALEIDRDEFVKDEEDLMYNIAELLVVHAPIHDKINGFRWYLKMTFTIPLEYVRANFSYHKQIMEEIPSTQPLFAFFFSSDQDAYIQMFQAQTHDDTLDVPRKAHTASGIDIGKQSVHSSFITKKVQMALERLFNQSQSIDDCTSIHVFEKCVKLFKESQAITHTDYASEKASRRQQVEASKAQAQTETHSYVVDKPRGIFQRLKNWCNKMWNSVFTPKPTVRKRTGVTVVKHPRPSLASMRMRMSMTDDENSVNGALHRIATDTTDFAIYNLHTTVKLFRCSARLFKSLHLCRLQRLVWNCLNG